MAARTKSRTTPRHGTKYRVTNWPSYEAALRIKSWQAPAEPKQPRR